MSVTINIADKQAVLADGKWRSADAAIAELLNLHPATLELPAHYPPAARERLAAEAAVQELGASIIRVRPILDSDTGLMPDGRSKVY